MQEIRAGQAFTFRILGGSFLEAPNPAEPKPNPEIICPRISRIWRIGFLYSFNSLNSRTTIGIHRRLLKNCGQLRALRFSVESARGRPQHHYRSVSIAYQEVEHGPAERFRRRDFG
jgi:hypothetical protein